MPYQNLPFLHTGKNGFIRKEITAAGIFFAGQKPHSVCRRIEKEAAAKRCFLFTFFPGLSVVLAAIMHLAELSERKLVANLVHCINILDIVALMLIHASFVIIENLFMRVRLNVICLLM